MLLCPLSLLCNQECNKSAKFYELSSAYTFYSISGVFIYVFFLFV